MDASEPARAHEADPGRAAGGERAADRRGADGALHDGRGEVARSDLARVGSEAPQLVSGQADADHAVEHADRGRHCARLPDATLALEPDLDAFAGRESVRDERRLQGDDGPALGERLSDLLGDGDKPPHGIDPSWATHRAAASSASAGPPTR